MKEKLLVYVAGPYTKGDSVLNIRKAVEIGEELVANGFGVYIPHLIHLWHCMIPHPEEYWIDVEIQVLYKCDCLYRILGESKGAHKEVNFARANDIPVFYSVEDLIIYKDNHENSMPEMKEQ